MENLNLELRLKEMLGAEARPLIEQMSKLADGASPEMRRMMLESCLLFLSQKRQRKVVEDFILTSRDSLDRLKAYDVSLTLYQAEGWRVVPSRDEEVVLFQNDVEEHGLFITQPKANELWVTIHRFEV